MKSSKTARLVTASLLTAACFVATAIIKIGPTFTGGYINAGDVLVLLSAFLLGPYWGAAAAGIGSALADLLSPAAIYAPGTLVIKALMALCAALIFQALGKKHVLAGLITGTVAAEFIMLGGYFVFESVFLRYGLGAAAEILPNGIQAVFGIAVGVPLYLAVRRFVKV